MTKPILPVAAAALSLAIAGCGSSHKPQPKQLELPSPPSSRLLTSGQRHEIRAGFIKVGTRVTCLSHGVRLNALVPPRPHTGRETYVTTRRRSGFTATLTITTWANGRVTERCR
jgi:hypothetical protein